MTTGWKGETPPDRAWKRSKGTSPAAEQDNAAGGHDRRVIPLDQGRIALGSVALRLYPKTRRIRAYLRWSDRGNTREAYLGEVDGETRFENLALAWNRAREKGVALPDADSDTDARGSWASSMDTRASMRGNRNKNTKPELLLRSRLHALGLRFRVGQRPVPAVRRTADIVFTKPRIAIFVDGCYWHACPEHYRPAKTNSEFWTEKIDANRRRDVETDQLLAEAGWQPIRVWEHENPTVAARRIVAIIRPEPLSDEATIVVSP